MGIRPVEGQIAHFIDTQELGTCLDREALRKAVLVSSLAHISLGYQSVRDAVQDVCAELKSRAPVLPRPPRSSLSSPCRRR